MITPIEELRRRNDAYINTMLQQKSEHSTEYIQAATLIFEERGLADPKKQELIKQYPALRKEVLLKYQEGMTSEDLLSYMLSKGMSKQDTLEMIKNAVNKELKASEKKKEKIKNRGLLIVAIIGVLYIVIRLWIKTR